MSQEPQENALVVDMTAEQLMALGYRVTSNRHLMVSRIDQPDWLERLARHLGRPVADFTSPGDPWRIGGWADYYRRVLSKDTLTVSRATKDAMKNSGHDSVGYIHKPGEPEVVVRQMWIGPGGALMSSVPIKDVTQDLKETEHAEDTMSFYGGRYMICETLRTSAAKRLAQMFGFEFVELKITYVDAQGNDLVPEGDAHG